jgi:hypothetical protein
MAFGPWLLTGILRETAGPVGAERAAALTEPSFRIPVKYIPNAVLHRTRMDG